MQIGPSDLNISVVSATRTFLPVDEALPTSLPQILVGLEQLNIDCIIPQPAFLTPLLQQMSLVLSTANLSLKTLSITKCQLTGAVDQIGDLVAPLVTELLDLSHNFLSGSIPSSWTKTSCNGSGPCYSHGNLTVRLAGNPGLDAEQVRQGAKSPFLFWILLAASLVLAACIITFVLFHVRTRPLLFPRSRRLSVVNAINVDGVQAHVTTTVVRRASANGCNNNK